MASLNKYMQDTYRLLNDQRFENVNPLDVREWVNIARRETVMRAQCIRFLTPISGEIVSASITAGGSGYTSPPAVTVSPPDFPSGRAITPNGAQATASAMTSGGEVVGLNILFGGFGYFQPVFTFSGGGGTGAAAIAQVIGINSLNGGQEEYPFKDIDTSSVPGCGAVYYIRSVSVIYSNYRYSLPMYAFSVYQAKIRQYPFQYQYVPAFCSQFGQGADGSLFVYPIPSQTYQFELDCLCLPQDLTTELSVDLIPDPWTDAVKYFALSLAYASLQNFNIARFYEDAFDKYLLRYSQYARIARMSNIYGRY